MTHRIKLSELAHLPNDDVEKILSELIDATKSRQNGGLQLLNARVKEYELRYEMTSEKFLQAISEGTVKETADFAKWLFLIETREAITTSQT